jgi:hypothetical protein
VAGKRLARASAQWRTQKIDHEDGGQERRDIQEDGHPVAAQSQFDIVSASASMAISHGSKKARGVYNRLRNGVELA